MRKTRPKKFYSKEIFISQLRKLMNELGIKEQKEFLDKVGVRQSNFSKWESGATAPSIETLLTIKNEFGVSLDWLLAGEEAKPCIQDTRLPPPLDTPLLAQVLLWVGSVLIETKIELEPDKKGRLVSLIYEHCIREKEKPNAVLIKRFLLLTD